MEWITYKKDERDLQKAGSIDKKACCEYVQILGGPDVDVDVALAALNLFDVVGITEQDASFSEMIRVISGGNGGATNENDRNAIAAADIDNDTYC